MIEFIMKRETEMTSDLLHEFIKRHQSERLPRYEELRRMYESDYDILHENKKDSYKPDNRLVANYAKDIVDTLNGFFIGVPIKIEHESDKINEQLEYVEAYNNIDDENAEISKTCSMFGHCYELIFTDEEAEVGVTKLSPEQAFIIYDDSIRRRPLYGVRYYDNVDKIMEGSFSTDEFITYFREGDKGLVFEQTLNHYFRAVPINEYKENEERQSAFESVKTLINAYNKALSEKANDVDYFADAYLAILGAEIDEDGVARIRDDRIINLYGTDDVTKIVVQFLEKPNADTTQENLINRLEKLIFQLSMVVNTNDENLGGNVSGISLKYKLQSMYNLAKTKERKFIAAFNRRYKMISNLPTSKLPQDAWIKIKYHFTRNLPNNLLEESEIAKNLVGVVSQETLLKVLSIVDDVKKEIERKENEDKQSIESLDRTGFENLQDKIDE